MQHAVSENVFAGTAMLRRAGYMYGAALDRGPPARSVPGSARPPRRAPSSLIAPTIDITHTGQTLTIDGVEIVFQMTPGTEAPAEMNFYFPQHRALCTAENTSHTLHNVLTLRGAWSATPTPGRTTSPRRSPCSATNSTWCSLRTTGPPGAANAPSSSWRCSATCTSICTTRPCGMINQGYTGTEIAEVIEMPPALDAPVAHPRLLRVGEPQREGDLPALHGLVRRQPRQPVAAPARRPRPRGTWQQWAAETGRSPWPAQAWDEGDYRWCAEVGKHVVFADDTDGDARALLADALEQLGYGAENGTWRNVYLAGATELRTGNFGTPATTSPDIAVLTQRRRRSSTASPYASTDRVRGTNTCVTAWTITDEDTTYVDRAPQRRAPPPHRRRGAQRCHQVHPQPTAPSSAWSPTKSTSPQPSPTAPSRSMAIRPPWRTSSASSPRSTPSSTSSFRNTHQPTPHPTRPSLSGSAT